MNQSAVTLLVACLIGLLIGTNALPSSKSSKTEKDHWGVDLTTPELIEYFGYPVEIHHLTTEDGYILELHRIPYGKEGPSENRPVAYLEHCLMCSSSDYIMNDPSEALAYVLADAGYDVWLSNMRGNTYSRNHTTLNPEEKEFWEFSWDEMAIYDVTASIDYALDQTGADGVYYVGWSMGTTVFWSLMSEKPEYNDKIKIMAALAPVAFTDNCIGPMRYLGEHTDELEAIYGWLGHGEMLPSDDTMQYVAENWCDQNSTMAEICHNALFLIGGPDADELDEEYLPIILSHTPAGTSVHTFVHFGQMIVSGRFCKYDFGEIGNLERYGQATPPDYDFSKITAPVGLFWGNSDWLATPTDVARLAEALPNLVLNYNVPKEEFNHLDFGWAIHANEYVYQRVLELFSNY